MLFKASSWYDVMFFHVDHAALMKSLARLRLHSFLRPQYTAGALYLDILHSWEEQKLCLHHACNLKGVDAWRVCEQQPYLYSALVLLYFSNQTHLNKVEMGSIENTAKIVDPFQGVVYAG